MTSAPMNREEACKILGLGPEASLETARRAYREQVKLWHPDRYSENSVLRSMALQNTRDANRAWAFLRTRLPHSAPRPKIKADSAAPRKRHAPQTARVSRSSQLSTLSEILDRCIAWASLLIGRFRQIRITGLAAWLRDDPNRHFRPWYRYSHEAEDNAARGRAETFGQTLANVMKKRNSVSLPRTSAPGREETRPPVAKRRDTKRPVCDDTVSAVSPVERSRKT